MAPPRTGSEPHVPPWRRVAAVDGREAQIRVVTTFGEEIARGPQWGAGGAVWTKRHGGEMGWTFLRILFSGHRLIDTPWIPVANGHGKLIQGDYRIF